MLYHYFEGAEGRLYCYNPRASFRCPFAEGPPGWLGDVLYASEDADVRSIDIERVWRNAHRSTGFDEGICRGCGAKLEKLGWQVWIEEPWPSEDVLVAEARAAAELAGEDPALAESSALSTYRMNQRLGSTHRRKPGSARYFPLRREAKAWAHQESAIDKDGARAGAAS